MVGAVIIDRSLIDSGGDLAPDKLAGINRLANPEVSMVVCSLEQVLEAEQVSPDFTRTAAKSYALMMSSATLSVAILSLTILRLLASSQRREIIFMTLF